MSKRSPLSPSADGALNSAAAPLNQTPAQSRRRQFIKASGALLFTAASPLFAQGEAIVAVRTWPSKDYTRVTLELDSPLKYSWQVIKDPDRLVLDIEDLQLTGKLKDLVSKVAAGDPYLSGVRAGQYKAGVV